MKDQNCKTDMFYDGAIVLMALVTLSLMIVFGIKVLKIIKASNIWIVGMIVFMHLTIFMDIGLYVQ